MNKKQFYILTTCCLVALLVLFEVVLFIAFGGERLEQSGWVKWLCAVHGFDRPAVLFAGLYHKSEVWRLKRITHKSTPCGLELHGALCYVYYFTLTDLVALQAE